jgi:hypothetical protein
MEELVKELRLTYESFINVILKETPGIVGFSRTIKTDDLIKGFLQRTLEKNGNNTLKYKTIGGGTYNIPEGQNIRFLQNPDTKFKGNIFEKINDKPNICIMGAGPNGLFMAIILHYALKQYDIDIHIVETRIDEEGNRKLERTQQLVNKTPIIVSEPAEKIFSKLIENIVPELYSKVFYVRKKDGIDIPQLDFMAIIPEYREFINNPRPNNIKPEFIVDVTPSFRTRLIQTRVVEFGLAREAQKLGIKIYHESEPAIKNSNSLLISKYTNASTLILCDSTGGRLFKELENFKEVTTITPNNSYYNESISSELRYRGTFKVFEGFLNPDKAIRPLSDSLLYIAVGDTTFRSDFRASKGLMLNWLLELMYMITISNFFKNNTNSSENIRIPFDNSYSSIFGGGKNNIINRMQHHSNLNNPARYSNSSRAVFNLCKSRKLANNSNAKRICGSNMISNQAKERRLKELLAQKPISTWPYIGYSKGGRSTRRNSRRTRGRRQ